MAKHRTTSRPGLDARRRWLVILALLLATGACVRSSVSRSVSQAVNQSLENEAIRLNTLGVAYMNLQRTEDALAAFEDAWALDTNLDEARLNQGIALFNMQRFEEAESVLTEMTRRDPDSVRAWYNLGLVFRNTGRSAEAASAFTEASRIDPTDADSWYLLGLMRSQLSEYAEAIRAFERALELNPFHVSSEYGLMTVYLRMRDIQAAQNHQAEFQRLEAEGLGVPMGAAYGDQGPYSAAADVAGIATRPGPGPDVAFTPVDAGIDFLHRRSESARISSYLGSGACFLDFNGDGQSDLLVQNGAGQPSLYRNMGGEFEQVDGALGLLPTDGTGCTAGDYDNDDDIDVALSFGTGVRLLSNDGLGQFADATLESGITIDGLTLGLTFIDFDHDGDLDLYAARFEALPWEAGASFTVPPGTSGPGNLLWRNNGNGTFVDWTAETALGGAAAGIAAVGSDLNNDRAIDFVTTGAGFDPGLFFNPREGAFRSPASFEMDLATPAGIAVIDFNKDNWMDLAFTHWGEPSLTVWENLEGDGFGRVAVPDFGWQRAWGIVAADYDNDGWIDLLAAGDAADGGEIRVLRNLGVDGFEDVSEALGLTRLAIDRPRSLVTADHDNDGDLDLFLTQNDGPVVVLRNDGGSDNAWLRLTFAGLNDNKSAIGTKVEVFAGAHRQKTEIYGGSGYLGQNALALVAGLGPDAGVDTVRMLWPTGVIQDEIQLGIREAHEILEIDRRGSSCPVLFAWNGSEFEFITDIIGAGVVGHWVAPGARNVSDPTEYVRVPGSSVALKDGRLSFRLVEPMEELVYLDQVRLLAVDHPAATEVYPHEYFAGVPPFADGAVIISGDRAPTRGAWDTNGQDVLDVLSIRDGTYVTSLEPTPFKGFMEPHTLELDLGEIDTNEPLRLLMHGFVDYFSATSVFAAHQAGITAILPYVEALDSSGRWIRVIDNLGFPAGLIRTMARDITGRLPEGTERIRITTNLKVYWDQILIDTTQGTPEVRITEVPLEIATLDWHGYPRAEAATLPGDIRYVYDQVSPTGPYARHAGYYTNFGDVTPLADTSDDRFAIFGSGEQVSLDFDPSALPGLEAGWTRDYFFYADGFAKDMDFYEAHASTVGPLPVHTDEPYPYSSGFGYPADRDALEYLVEANARASSGRENPSYRFAYPGGVPD